MYNYKIILLLLLTLFNSCKREVSSYKNYEDSLYEDDEYGLNDLIEPSKDDSIYIKFKKNHAFIIDSLKKDYLKNRNTYAKSLLEDSIMHNNSACNDQYALELIKINCTPCHQKFGTTPFYFDDINKLKLKSRTIQHVILNKTMPPWTANEGYNIFFNAPKITNKDRLLLVDWLNKLKIRGNIKNKKIHPINLINSNKNYIEFEGKSFTIDSNEDFYKCISINLNNDKDIYLSSIEYKLNINGIVHHIMTFIDTANSFNNKMSDCNSINLNKTIPIDGYTMGMRPIEFTNFAYRIPKKSKLILQIHVRQGENKGKKLKPIVKLYNSHNNKNILEFLILNNFNIFIPKNKVITQSIIHKTKDSIAIIGLSPHMHYLARTCKAYAVTPEGKIISIISFSDWNYDWGGRFIYYKPIVIPKNSIIYLDVVFDNTDKNIYQPNSPIRDIYFELSSKDEMLSFYGYYTKYYQGIENLEIAKFLY